MTSNGHTLGGHHSTGGTVNRGHLQNRIQSKLKKQLQLHKEQLTQLQVRIRIACFIVIHVEAKVSDVMLQTPNRTLIRNSCLINSSWLI